MYAYKNISYIMSILTLISLILYLGFGYERQGLINKT